MKLSIPVGDAFAVLPASVCGVAGPFTGELFFDVSQFTLWDNGHFVFTSTNSVRLVDILGNMVLRDRAAVHDVGGPSALPESFGFRIVSHCTPASAAPGKLYETHITITIGVDGSIKIHGAFCDPTAYPFC